MGQTWGSIAPHHASTWLARLRCSAEQPGGPGPARTPPPPPALQHLVACCICMQRPRRKAMACSSGCTAVCTPCWVTSTPSTRCTHTHQNLTLYDTSQGLYLGHTVNINQNLNQGTCPLRYTPRERGPVPCVTSDHSLTRVYTRPAVCHSSSTSHAA
jgi:hypothetical protein